MEHGEMDVRDWLLDMERGFWTGGPDYYEKHLADDCVMTFPGMGTLDRNRIVASITEAPRWSEVALSDERLLAVDENAMLMLYSATARRNDTDTPYAALCTSVYRREGGRWRLVFHQQSPASF